MLGWIHEVVASIQGEGPYCGQRQTFVRMAGCNLACDYCDTAYARAAKPDTCKVNTACGKSCLEEIANPVSAEKVLSVCRKLGSGVVALTGGEPLMQADFAVELMPALKDAGFVTYLETNGTVYDVLRRVVDWAHVIAMDVKLPSSGGQGEMWEAHSLFLRIASKTEVFVKAVVVPNTTEGEIRRCAELIEAVNRSVPLIIQPAEVGARIPGELLIRLQDAAMERLSDVRVIPQCHKILGLP